MSESPPQPAASARRQGFDPALAVILAAALVTRLYRLGGPGLWADEILHAAVASLTAPELFEYVNRFREGLMYYFFVVKAMSLFGTEEWVLRLPAALAGTLGVYFCHRLGESLAGRTAGLTAALLAAANLMLIAHSRQVLGYGLFFCLAALSSWLYLKVARSRFADASLSLVLVNAAATLIYPAGFYLAATEAGLLVLTAARHWRDCARGRAVLYVVLTALSLAPLVVKTLTFPAAEANGSFVTINPDPAVFFSEFGRALLEAVNPASLADGWSFVLLGLCAAGLSSLARTVPATALACLGLVLAPGLGMFLTINDVFVFTHRVVYALPVLYALCGAALSRFVPKRTPAGFVFALAACVWAGYILVQRQADLYAPSAERFVLFKVADYRRLARELDRATRPGEPIIFSDLNNFRELRWYFRDDPGNHVLTQDISPGQGDLTVYFLSNRGDFGHLTPEVREMFAKPGQPAGGGRDLDGYNTLYATTVRRDPTPLVEGPVFRRRATFGDLDYFREVHAQRKALLKPFFGGRLIPADNSGDCFAVWAFRMDRPGPRTVFGNLAYDNERPGNMIEVAFSTDGQTYQPVHFGRAAGLGRVERFVFYPPPEASELYVRTRLTTRAWPPGQFLFNADTLRLARLELFGCESGLAHQCDHENIVASSPVDLAPGPDAGTAPPVLSEAGTRLADAPGWTLIEPARNGDPATVRVRVRKNGPLSLYPRVSAEADGARVVEAPSGRQLLYLTGLGRGFTPMGLRYELPLDHLADGQETELEISLTGRAQLWSRDGAVVFGPAP